MGFIIVVNIFSAILKGKKGGVSLQNTPFGNESFRGKTHKNGVSLYIIKQFWPKNFSKLLQMFVPNLKKIGQKLRSL